MYSVKY